MNPSHEETLAQGRQWLWLPQSSLTSPLGFVAPCLGLAQGGGHPAWVAFTTPSFQLWQPWA